MPDSIQNNYIQNKPRKPAFGNWVTVATNATARGIKGIENGGVLADFCLVDTVSMVIPRTYQAYHRNEEELGHLNYKAGKEELIREIFSGPSVYFVPAAFVGLSGKLFGKASKIRFETLDSLTGSFKRTLNNGKSSKEDFYRKVINEVFEPHRKIKLENPVNLNENIEKIVQKLSKVETVKKPKPYIQEIKDTVSDLNKAHGLHIDNSRNVTLKDGLTTNIASLVGDLTKYSKDVVEKVAGNTKILDKVHESKVLARRGTLAAAILATSAVLYSVPLMYKRNKQFPGIDGLVQNENKPHNISELKKDIGFTGKNKTSEKTHDNKQKNKKDVAFGANSSKVDGFFRNLDFNGSNVPYKVLAFFTFGMMLGMRLLQARNEDERREVATRDFSGLLTITFAVPVIRNITSAIAGKRTGIPIAKPIKSALGYLNPNNKPFSFENITDVYSGISKYKNGIVDVAKNIHNNGGNIGKVLRYLTNDSKKELKQISPDFFSKSNEEAIKLLKNNKQSLKKVITELDKKDNKIVKRAESLKSIPEAASIVAISGFLGWFLPWFNINYTKKLYKDKNRKIPTIKQKKLAFDSFQKKSDILEKFNAFTDKNNSLFSPEKYLLR